MLLIIWLNLDIFSVFQMAWHLKKYIFYIIFQVPEVGFGVYQGFAKKKNVSRQIIRNSNDYQTVNIVVNIYR